MADQFIAPGDPFADYDAAYVLGALSPDDRSAYEAHLATCAECRAAVAAIAGVPGLLARVPIDQVLAPAPAEPPAALLPRLLSAAAAERRRTRWRTAAIGLVAAACIVAALVVALVAENGGRGTVAGPGVTVSSSTTAPVPQRDMRVVGATDLRATVGIQSVRWGTKIVMHCTYPASSSPGAGQYAENYGLVYVPRTGAPVAGPTWNSVAGRTISIEGDTHLNVADLAKLEVVDHDGTTILEYDL